MKKAKMLCAFALVAGSLAALASCNTQSRKLKLGIGMISAAPAESYGSWQLEINFAATAWDENNKVVASLLDVYQVQLGDGDLNTSDSTYYFANSDETKTKRDRHDDYGMVNPPESNAAQGEWYVQAEKLENWTKGKTVSQLNPEEGGAVGSANVSIQTGTLLDAVKESATGFHVSEVAEIEGENLTLALGHSMNYDRSEEGVLTQVNASVLALVLDSDKVIRQAFLDEIQIPLTYTPASTEEPDEGGDTPQGTADGTSEQPGTEENGGNSEGEEEEGGTTTPASWTITAGKNQVGHDAGQAVSSKKEMHNDYGMTPDLEYVTQGNWYEQAKKFEDYLVGKKASDVSADSDGKLEAADVSISTGTYFAALTNAVNTSLYNSKTM